MVYCSKCGTRNSEDAKICSNCGAPLYSAGERYPGSDREYYRKVENECFGIPNGGMIVGLIIGVIIILFGVNLFLQATYNVSLDLWPLILIIVGVLILVGALYRRRRYRIQ